MKENAFTSKLKFDLVPTLFFFTYFAASAFWIKSPLAILLIAGLLTEAIIAYFIYLKHENPVRLRQAAHSMMLLLYWSFGVFELRTLFPAAPETIVLLSYVLPGGVIVWGFSKTPTKVFRIGQHRIVVDSFATQLALGGLFLATTGIVLLFMRGMDLVSIGILTYGSTTFMIGKDYFHRTWRRFWALNKIAWLAVLGGIFQFFNGIV